MRLASPLGFTVLDYTIDGGEERLWLASEGRVVGGDELASVASFSPDAVRWIFLRQGHLDSHCRQRPAGEEITVECGTAVGAEYRGHVQSGSGLLLREVVLREGEPLLTVRYGNYRVVGSVRLPHSIVWAEPRSGTRVDIEIRAYEVNPELPEELFAPSPGGR